jgi:Spy/CpxP family protein refolding chaperone
MMTVHKKHLTQWGAVLVAASVLCGAAITTVQAAPAITPAAATTAAPETPSVKDFNKLKRTLKKLNLTPEQQTQVDQLTEQARPQATKIQEEMHANMQKLKALMYSSNYDAKAVSTLANNQGQLLSQMLVLRAKLNSDIYKVLTPEQQQQLHTLMEEKAARKNAPKK